jgi:hypothetical protein
MVPIRKEIVEPGHRGVGQPAVAVDLARKHAKGRIVLAPRFDEDVQDDNALETG